MPKAYYMLNMDFHRSSISNQNGYIDVLTNWAQKILCSAVFV